MTTHSAGRTGTPRPGVADEPAVHGNGGTHQGPWTRETVSNASAMKPGGEGG